MESYNVVVFNIDEGPLGLDIQFMDNSLPLVSRVRCPIIQELGVRPGQSILRLNGTDIRNNTQGWFRHTMCTMPLHIAFGTWADDHLSEVTHASGDPWELHMGWANERGSSRNEAPRHWTPRLAEKPCIAAMLPNGSSVRLNITEPFGLAGTTRHARRPPSAEALH